MTTAQSMDLSRFRALATDYDGTLAHDGAVQKTTLAALQRLKGAGHRLVLVTGRVIHELVATFPEYRVFDLIVAENGALLFHPETQKAELLGPRPPSAFIAALYDRVLPLQTGHAIVATWEPHEKAVLETIKEMGLELQVIFNKGAVMILPSGVNKATGLRVALRHLEIDSGEVVGIGDAENDHALLEACGLAVAVSNALPALKEKAHFVTEADHGDGVVELIDRLLAVPAATT
jgi:hydroxymethylpyrimidine pyrophosphatase-like HAD family hydrolase